MSMTVSASELKTEDNMYLSLRSDVEVRGGNLGCEVSADSHESLLRMVSSSEEHEE
jgi:hypothetical protein